MSVRWDHTRLGHRRRLVAAGLDAVVNTARGGTWHIGLGGYRVSVRGESFEVYSLREVECFLAGVQAGRAPVGAAS